MPDLRFAQRVSKLTARLMIAIVVCWIVGGEVALAQKDDPFADPPIRKAKPRVEETDDPFGDSAAGSGTGKPVLKPPAESIPRPGQKPKLSEDDPFGTLPPDFGAPPPSVLPPSRGLPPRNDIRSSPLDSPETDGTIRTRRPASIPSSEFWSVEQIDPRVFKEVEDNTMGLTVEDNAPYFSILDFTRRMPMRDQSEAARLFKHQRWNSDPRFRERAESDFPQFVDLFQNPDEYRGRPITLRGYFRRVVDLDPGENPFGLFTLYEGWLFTTDSQGNPAVVIFTELPEGMPVGGDVEEDVVVTGYFFKMYGYRGQDVNRRSPMILARSVHWMTRPKPLLNGIPWESFVVVTIAVLFVVYAVWLFHDYQRKMRDVRLRQMTQSVSFDHLPAESSETLNSTESVGPDDA